MKRGRCVTRSGRSLPHIALLVRYPRTHDPELPFATQLGADAAAALHHRVAKHALREILALQACREATAVVRCDAAFMRAAREWLGRGPRYRYLGDHGRGDSVRRALGEGFSAKAPVVAVVGIEAPTVDAALLRRALDLARATDVVIGAGHDGRCYLVAARRSAAGSALSTVLRDAPWGEDAEAAGLERLAAEAGLSVARLETLDRPGVGDDPEQVARALDVRAVSLDSRVSVVVPAFDEAATVADTVRAALDGGAFEVIVADGGSTDRTRSEAEQAGARLVSSARGRAAQMNAGAAVANGDVLCFCHADTLLPADFASAATRALARPGTVGAGFDFAVPVEASHAPLITRLGQARWRATGVPYGDQCLTIPRTIFDALGGFPEQPVMEDWELAMRLRALGDIARVPLPAVTSARVWERYGLLVPTLVNGATIALYRLGLPAERIAWLRRRIAPGRS